jgi:hypothetical protein
MVAISDFSGLVSSPWALASAAAMAPMVSLERCIGGLHIRDVKADSARFRPFGAQAMADGLLGILRHQLLQIGTAFWFSRPLGPNEAAQVGDALTPSRPRCVKSLTLAPQPYKRVRTSRAAAAAKGRSNGRLHSHLTRAHPKR